MEAFLNPHLGWLWFFVLKHCADNDCPVLVAHSVVVALIACGTALLLLMLRELWLLQEVLRRQY
ncbi:hypothetical protein BAC2_03786 [uncultured bacterium]|nr:hypothetical protein BAC2_03786 [uncultured bacterium]